MMQLEDTGQKAESMLKGGDRVLCESKFYWGKKSLEEQKRSGSEGETSRVYFAEGSIENL